MERTLCIIKPDAIKKKFEGEIIKKIINAGFVIIAIKKLQLTSVQAEAFYEIHRSQPFFKSLIEFMTSGTCIVIALEKENAVAEYRNLIGATDPVEARENTIRKLFGTNKQENAVHGSDSKENGLREVSFFFSEAETLSS